MQPTADGQDATDISLVTRLQLRVKELEWERATLQSEIDSKQSNNMESSAAVDQPTNEVADATNVWTACMLLYNMFYCNDRSAVSD